MWKIILCTEKNQKPSEKHNDARTSWGVHVDVSGKNILAKLDTNTIVDDVAAKSNELRKLLAF